MKRKNEDKHVWDKKHCKVWDCCHYTREYRGAAHAIGILQYNVPKEILLVSHNGSNYDYHFIIIELAEEFQKQFTYLGGNTKRYITFPIPIQK